MTPSPSTTQNDRTTILFLLNEEHGQANIHLILAQALVKKYGPNVDIHFCSFSKVGARLAKDNVEGITYHELQGKGMMDAYTDNWKADNPGQRAACGAGFAHKPNLFGALRSITLYKPLLIPWANDEYLRIVRDVESVLMSIKPGLAIIDPLCTFGTDACRQQGIEMICLSPVSWGMNARAMGDVNEKFALKWPAIGSAYPNPLPWYLFPANILQVIFAGLWILLISPAMRSFQRARLAAGLSPLHPLLHSPRPILCPGTRALDLPGVHSDGLVPFGPIMHPYPPLAELDPELDAWLARGGNGQGAGKTLLIVLGSHFRFDAREVRAMMTDVKALMEQRKDVQVLWKLKPDDAHAEASSELRGWIKGAEGRVRVVDWLEVDPPALMQTGCIGAFVHHGGGNSYQEAIGCGVPQVIVAGWVDCYDFAQRANELGVGIWANQADAPSISSSPLASAFLTILGPTPTDSIAQTYARRAKQVALIAREADSMPRVPTFAPNAPAGAGVMAMRARKDGDELDVIKVARAAAAAKGQGKVGSRGDSGIATPSSCVTLADGHDRDSRGEREIGEGECGQVYVEGRDVAVEWIWKYVRGVKDVRAQEVGQEMVQKTGREAGEEYAVAGAGEDAAEGQLRERKVGVE